LTKRATGKCLISVVGWMPTVCRNNSMLHVGLSGCLPDALVQTRVVRRPLYKPVIIRGELPHGTQLNLPPPCSMENSSPMLVSAATDCCAGGKKVQPELTALWPRRFTVSHRCSKGFKRERIARDSHRMPHKQNSGAPSGTQSGTRRND
jgi:hypothetical protein